MQVEVIVPDEAGLLGREAWVRVLSNRGEYDRNGPLDTIPKAVREQLTAEQADRLLGARVLAFHPDFFGVPRDEDSLQFDHEDYWLCAVRGS